MAIQSFGNQLADDLFHGENTKETRKFPKELHSKASRKLGAIDLATNINDLRIPPSNHLEKLKGELKAKYSIKINDQWRIVFEWGNDGPRSVQIVDYH